VTPVLKVAHVGVGLAIVRLEEVVDLAVIELVGDNIGDASLGSTSGDVLAVVSATNGSRWNCQSRRIPLPNIQDLRVVLPNTRRRDLSGILRHVRTPSDCGGRVVGTVHVVVLEDGVLECAIGEAGGGKAGNVDRVAGSEDTDGVNLAGRGGGALRSRSCHGASGRGQDGEDGGEGRHGYAC